MVHNGDTQRGLHLHLAFHREGLHIGGVGLVSWSWTVNVYQVGITVVLALIQVALTVDLKTWERNISKYIPITEKTIFPLWWKQSPFRPTYMIKTKSPLWNLEGKLKFSAKHINDISMVESFHSWGPILVDNQNLAGSLGCNFVGNWFFFFNKM